MPRDYHMSDYKTSVAPSSRYGAKQSRTAPKSFVAQPETVYLGPASRWGQKSAATTQTTPTKPVSGPVSVRPSNTASSSLIGPPSTMTRSISSPSRGLSRSTPPCKLKPKPHIQRTPSATNLSNPALPTRPASSSDVTPPKPKKFDRSFPTLDSGPRKPTSQPPTSLSSSASSTSPQRSAWGARKGATLDKSAVKAAVQASGVAVKPREDAKGLEKLVPKASQPRRDSNNKKRPKSMRTAAGGSMRTKRASAGNDRDAFKRTASESTILPREPQPRSLFDTPSRAMSSHPSIPSVVNPTKLPVSGPPATVPVTSTNTTTTPSTAVATAISTTNGATAASTVGAIPREKRSGGRSRKRDQFFSQIKSLSSTVDNNQRSGSSSPQDADTDSSSDASSSASSNSTSPTLNKTTSDSDGCSSSHCSSASDSTPQHSRPRSDICSSADDLGITDIHICDEYEQRLLKEFGWSIEDDGDWHLTDEEIAQEKEKIERRSQDDLVKKKPSLEDLRKWSPSQRSQSSD